MVGLLKLPCLPAPAAKRMAPSRDSPEASVTRPGRSRWRVRRRGRGPTGHRRIDGRCACRPAGRPPADRASSTAAASAPPGSVSRLASPMCSASSPLTPRPVRMRSSAWLWPISRGQPDGAAVDERDAPSPAVDAEGGVGRRHPQVAPHGQLEPAGHRMALDRGDDRLGQQHPRRSHRAVTVDGDPVAAPVGDPLEIGTRAERAAGAREHGDGQVVVGLEAAEGVGQRVGRRTVDRVAHLGSVDRDRPPPAHRVRSGPSRLLSPGRRRQPHGAARHGVPLDLGQLEILGQRCARSPGPGLGRPAGRPCRG